MKMTSLFSLKQSPMRRLPLKGSAALVLVLLLMSSATGDQHWKDLHSEVQRGDVVPLEVDLAATALLPDSDTGDSNTAISNTAAIENVDTHSTESSED